MISDLTEAGIEFSPPLSGKEVVSVEDRFEIQFPSDLRAFLQTALPKGKYFPDWRDGSELQLTNWLNGPREGVLFDVEFNNFWLPEWGLRPNSVDEAKAIAGQLVDHAPKLIPIYAHRMIPSEPFEEGNPVFSVHQTDIIIYGIDLQDYLLGEFLLSKMKKMEKKERKSPRKIRFWDIDRFQKIRWNDGACFFDNRDGTLS